MSDRYWKETSCEHGYVHPHCDIHIWCIEPDICELPLNGCSGGSRVELFPATPNYEAAIRMFDDEYGNGTAGQWMKATVDAGLVGVVLLQEKTAAATTKDSSDTATP